MANIREYRAPNVALNPSDRGARAFDTAGRRLGPLYNAAASDIREQGRIEAALIRARGWPYDILALYERRRQIDAQAATAAPAEQGVAFRVRGGAPSGFGGSSETWGGGGGGGRGRSTGDHSRAGRAAGDLSGLARSAARWPAEQTIGGGGEFKRPRYVQRLDQGNSVWYDTRTGNPVGKVAPGPNQKAFDDAQKLYEQGKLMPDPYEGEGFGRGPNKDYSTVDQGVSSIVGGDVYDTSRTGVKLGYEDFGTPDYSGGRE